MATKRRTPLLALISPLKGHRHPRVVLPRRLGLPFILNRPAINRLINSRTTIIFRHRPTHHPPIMVVSMVTPPIMSGPPLINRAIHGMVRQRQRNIIFKDNNYGVNTINNLLGPSRLPRPLTLIQGFRHRPIRHLRIKVNLVNRRTSTLIRGPTRTTRRRRVTPLLLSIPYMSRRQAHPSSGPTFRSTPSANNIHQVNHSLIRTLHGGQFQLSKASRLLQRHPRHVNIRRHQRRPIREFVMAGGRRHVRGEID